MFVAVNDNNVPANGWRYRTTLQRWMDFRCVNYIIKVDNRKRDEYFGKYF